MRLVDANGKGLLISKSGEIHAPESLFLNSRYDNPHSRATVSLGLRLLHILVRLVGVYLPQRALEGHCLYAPEVGWLANLAFRPVEELEAMNPRMLLRLAKSEDTPHRDRAGAVTASTASARLHQIGEYLKWYFENVLDPRIRSAQARTELKERYDTTVRELKGKIRGGKSKHPTQVRSLPTDVFIRVIREAWVNPEVVFCSESGATSVTAQRDRAIFLLACEGMRPGAIGNLALQDFLGSQMRIVDNVRRRGEAPTEGTPVQKGARSNLQAYSSELNITLWPWTTAAIHEYIQGERVALLKRTLHNASKGFLFLEYQYAGPIRSRKTISLIFNRAARRGVISISVRKVGLAAEG
jgi:integrase